MMLRDDYVPRPQQQQVENESNVVVNAPISKGVVGGKTNKWTANKDRIVLAPVSINQQQSEKVDDKVMPSPTLVAVTAPIIDVAPLQSSPVASPLPSPIAASIASVPVAASVPKHRSTLSELVTRESNAKEAMDIAGKACMDAWTAALEASREYRRVRKEWRKAKLKLEKKQQKHAPVEPASVALVEVAAPAEEEAPADVSVESETQAPAAIVEEVDTSPLEALASAVDEVEEMEQAVHNVEQAELQYAALVEPEEAAAVEEEEEAEEQQETNMETNAAAAARPNFGVLSFSFGGNKGLQRTQPKLNPTSYVTKPTAADKARAAQLKAKLEADMKAHEARRLQLQEAQRLKQVEQERRRAAAKEKVEEQMSRRTAGKMDEVERKRLEAEVRRTKAHDEEKRKKVSEKEKKRKELEKEMADLRAKEKAHAKKHGHTASSKEGETSSQ